MRVAQHYLDAGLQDTGATNLVTSVIHDYRVFDTSAPWAGACAGGFDCVVARDAFHRLADPLSLLRYLRQLAEYKQPTVLLVVAPAARDQTLWRELSHRLVEAGHPT